MMVTRTRLFMIRRQIPIYIGPDLADEIESYIDAKIEAFNKARETAAE
jgi:hypothetical protein